MEAVWKRQTAAAECDSSLAERPKRQAAVDRSRCSRLTSRRSPVRAGHRPSPGVRFRSEMFAVAATGRHVATGAVEALSKREGHDGLEPELFRLLVRVRPRPPGPALNAMTLDLPRVTC